MPFVWALVQGMMTGLVGLMLLRCGLSIATALWIAGISLGKSPSPQFKLEVCDVYTRPQTFANLFLLCEMAKTRCELIFLIHIHQKLNTFLRASTLRLSSLSTSKFSIPAYLNYATTYALSIVVSIRSMKR